MPNPDELARVLARIEHGQQMADAQTTAVARIAVRRCYELGYVAQTAMRELARLAKLERELATVSPKAAGRLAVVADAAVGFLVDVVAAARRSMLTEPDTGDRQ